MFRTIRFNIGKTRTPIIPIIIGDAIKTILFWQDLMEAGICSNPVISPAVPEGNELIRTSFMSTHTDQHLDKVLNALEYVGQKFGLIKSKQTI